MGGFGGMNLNQLMKEAKKMQSDVEKSQEELAAKEFEASAGGEAVKVKVSGSKQIKEIKIKPAASDKTVQVMAIASSCIFVIPKIESKHDKQHEETNIRAIQIINPALRCDILLLSFNQSITFIDYYFICST